MGASVYFEHFYFFFCHKNLKVKNIRDIKSPMAISLYSIIEPPHDKNNKMTFAPSEDSDQPGHPPSLIRVFTVHMKKAWVLSYPVSAQWRLWSDWADALADLSLCWAHRSFCWFCHEAAQLLSWYHKNVKSLDTGNKCCNYPKIWRMWFYHRVPSGAGWSGSALFAQTRLSKA